MAKCGVLHFGHAAVIISASNSSHVMLSQHLLSFVCHCDIPFNLAADSNAPITCYSTKYSQKNFKQTGIYQYMSTHSWRWQ